MSTTNPEVEKTMEEYNCDRELAIGILEEQEAMQSETNIETAFQKLETAFSKVPRVSRRLERKIAALSKAENVERKTAFDILYHGDIGLLNVDRILADTSQWNEYCTFIPFIRFHQEHIVTILRCLLNVSPSCWLSVPEILEWIDLMHKDAGITNTFTTKDVDELIALHECVMNGIVPLF